MKHLACLYKHVTFYQKSLFSFVMDFRDSKLGTLSGGCLNYGRLYYPDNLLQIQRERETPDSRYLPYILPTHKMVHYDYR